MSYFNGFCPKCKSRFGWQGPRSPCPSCGHQISQAKLDADYEEFKSAKAELAELFRAKQEEQEASYQKYSAQREAYRKCIELEDDPNRQAVLEKLLADLNEDNK